MGKLEEEKMLRVGIIGLPSSGKTILAREMSSQCKCIKYIQNVELVTEYARKYISECGFPQSILEQYMILEKQCEWEDSVCNNQIDIMITDSPVFLGFVYCCDLQRKNSKELMFFNDIFKKMSNLNFPNPRYDIIFYLPPVVLPMNDNIRPKEHFDSEWRYNKDMLIHSTFQIFKPKVFHSVKIKEIKGRTNECVEVIKTYLTKNQIKKK